MRKNAEIKELYNTIIGKKYADAYEFNRWFSSRRLRLDYAMMYRALSYHVSQCSFNSCFELGPGPGTWTRVLYRHAPEASYTLVDISEEMKQQFFLEMRSVQQVRYLVADVHDVSIEEKKDLFFSSRAIEYIERPEEVCTKIHAMLREQGAAIIVTKNPDHVRARPASKRREHTTQLPHDVLTSMLRNAGFGTINVYPCIMRIPIVDRFADRFAEKLFTQQYKHAIQDRLTRFAESYVVVAKK